jgi:hypothetical protein
MMAAFGGSYASTFVVARRSGDCRDRVGVDTRHLSKVFSPASASN